LPVAETHPLNSKNAYGASKAAAETYCRVFQNTGKLEVAILRLSNVYGLRDFDRVIPIFINNVLSGQDLTIYGGQQVIDFIAVPIVINALDQAAGNQSILEGPVNVGSGKGTTLYELAKQIMSLFKMKSKIHVEPARSVEVVRYTANTNRFQSVFSIPLPEDPLEHLADISALFEGS